MFAFGTFGHLVVSCFIPNPRTVTISAAFSKEIHSFPEQMGKHTLGWALGMLMNFLSREPSCTGKAHLIDKGILTQISYGFKPTNTKVEEIHLFATLVFFFFFFSSSHLLQYQSTDPNQGFCLSHVAPWCPGGCSGHTRAKMGSAMSLGRRGPLLDAFNTPHSHSCIDRVHTREHTRPQVHSSPYTQRRALTVGFRCTAAPCSLSPALVPESMLPCLQWAPPDTQPTRKLFFLSPGRTCCPLVLLPLVA